MNNEFGIVYSERFVGGIWQFAFLPFQPRGTYHLDVSLRLLLEFQNIYSLRKVVVGLGGYPEEILLWRNFWFLSQIKSIFPLFSMEEVT
jgi:hypothetical protein